jgi:high-affinity nickel permease
VRDSEGGVAKVQTLPARSFHCAQSCLLIAIAIAILLFAVGCFGLWAIADYVMIDILGWQYRDPIAEIIPLLDPRSLSLGIAALVGVL